MEMDCYYERWKTYDNYPSPSCSKILAELTCGFYYTGIGHICRCYKCGLEIDTKNSSYAICAKYVHAESSPDCPVANAQKPKTGLRRR